MGELRQPGAKGPGGSSGSAKSKPHWSAEAKERAVRMVYEAREEPGGYTGAISRVASLVGVSHTTVGRWVAAAEVDAGMRPGLTTAERARLRALERENRELRRANEILKAASAFFAAELDRPDQR
jgi:transposase